MTVQEKIDNILYRLNQGIPNYSSEDLFIISKRPELQIPFLKLFAHNDSIVEANKESYEMIKLVTTSNNNVITEEEKELICYNFIRMNIRLWGYNNPLYEMSSIPNISTISSETKERVIAEFFSDPNNHFEECYFNEVTLQKLLDYKRYDVIATLPKLSIHSEELIERLQKECPPNMISPQITYDRTIDDTFANGSIEELIKKHIEYKEALSVAFPGAIVGRYGDRKEIIEKMNQIREAVYNRILISNDLSSLNNEYYYFIITQPSPDDEEKEQYIFPYSKSREIAYLLYQKNCILYAELLIKEEIVSEEEMNKKLDYLINNSSRIPSCFIDNINDDNILRKIIDQGEYGLLYLINLGNQDDNIKRFMPYIVKSIKTNPFYDKPRMLEPYFMNYPEIYAAYIESGAIGTLNFNKIGNDDNTKTILLKLLRKKRNVSGLYDLNELVWYLIENGIVWLINELDEITLMLRMDMLLPILLSNVEETNIFINKHINVICMKKEFLHELFSENIYIDTLINKLNHFGALLDIYDDDIFQKTKLYHSKKYNLNLEHYEKLEKRFGPNILKYIENEQLYSLINLNDEEFYKILNLFPQEKYNMVDLEAAYKSLMQRLFVIKNSNSINIFPNFIHAVDDNDIESLNKIKEELIINTKLDFLMELVNKYQLINIRTTKELLDLISEKLKTPEREDYLTILHELTDNYINNARSYFLVNNYVDEKYPEYANLCQKILICLKEDNIEEIHKFISLFERKIDGKIFEHIRSNKYLPIEIHAIDKEMAVLDLISNLFAKLSNPDTRDEYLPLLKEIADYCHDKVKSEHQKEVSLEEQLNLSYNLDKKNREKEIIKYLIVNSEMYYIRKIDSTESIEELKKPSHQKFTRQSEKPEIECTLEEAIIEGLEKEGLSESLAHAVLDYYISDYNGGKKHSEYPIEEVQKHIGLLIKVATNIINNKLIIDKMGIRVILDRDSIITDILNSKYKIKRQYYIPKSSIDMYQILLGLNLDLIRENLLQNEENYNGLINIMKKKKLHLLPNNLKKLIESCGISNDCNDIASFINYYTSILEAERKRFAALGKNPDDILKGLASILVQAETYGGASSVYSQILGPKDAKLIKANPGPNSAYTYLANNERLNKAIEYTISNYRRKEITVPSFDETVEVNNSKKKIDIIVGNFTDPSNITHGERTGACMRIGGVGESFFDFCLTDPNGFHIRFEDSTTHEYISRVSGFRNGNTVFLNELRYSRLKKYSNDDVVEACRIAARKLIEYSKNSTCPIENVVITNQYATSESKDEIVQFNIKNNKEGLRQFYTDIDTSGIVLATIATNTPLVPINFDKTKVPNYQPVRTKPRFLDSPSELAAKINRVASIKELLNGISYEELGSLSFDDGLLYGVVSDDWYIYVDYNLNIHKDYITLDPRAEKEFKKYSIIIEEMLKNNEIKVGEEYGIQSNSNRKS